MLICSLDQCQNLVIALIGIEQSQVETGEARLGDFGRFHVASPPLPPMKSPPQKRCKICTHIIYRLGVDAPETYGFGGVLLSSDKQMPLSEAEDKQLEVLGAESVEVEGE